jgi:type IV pilus assembly protein PilA
MNLQCKTLHVRRTRGVSSCEMKRRGFSLVELLIVVAIITLIVTIAVPYFNTARINAAETVVIREVQTIHQAQIQYQQQFGNYAQSLAQLGPPAGGAASPAAANLIPASLASGERNGYRFTLHPSPTGFVVQAEPKAFGSTGRRTFYLDENGTVHQNWGQAAATAESPDAQ